MDSKRYQYARAIQQGGAWYLPNNPVWNVPPDVTEVTGEMQTVGPWSIIRKYSALVVGFHGYVYGVRSLTNVRESGYELEGTVSLFGRKWRAFTSSQLFQRADGSLVSVATIHACLRGRVPRQSDLSVGVTDVSDYRYTHEQRPEFGYKGYAYMAVTVQCGYRDDNMFSAEIECGEPF